MRRTLFAVRLPDAEIDLVDAGDVIERGDGYRYMQVRLTVSPAGGEPATVLVSTYLAESLAQALAAFPTYAVRVASHAEREVGDMRRAEERAHYYAAELDAGRDWDGLRGPSYGVLKR